MRLARYKHLSGEFIGANVFTGNIFALFDDPYSAIEASGPYAFTVHFKGQTQSGYERGLLLADIPHGQGSFNMQRIAASLRFAREVLGM
jgi:hypothetical protein